MKTIHPIWLKFFKAVGMAFFFVISMIIFVGLWPEFRDLLDKSDQQKVGIVLLAIGSVAFIIMFIARVIKR